MPLSTDTTSATNVAETTQRLFVGLFPGANHGTLERVFSLTDRIFTGQHPEFHAVDLKYHDYRHTLQVTVCATDLLAGHLANNDPKPALTSRHFELCVAAALLHDTGYLKSRADHAGTGAKYTYCHVLRSCAIAASYLPACGFNLVEIDVVLGAIRRTSPAPAGTVPRFRNTEEHFIACVVASSDYLAQMAAPDYPDELGMLYDEFTESDDFIGTPAKDRVFKSAADLAQRTPKFWEKVVKTKLEKDFGGVCHLIDEPDGANPYIDAIEKNLAVITKRAAATG
ncbi:MAG: HD domain-containing protein [Verrucomicrobiota bacterium]